MAPLVMGLGLALTLAACGTPSGAAGGGHATPTPPRPVSGSSAATPPGWSSVHNGRYGFTLPVPSGATPRVSSGGPTELVLWSYASPANAADVAAFEATVSTQASAGICSQYTHGQPVSVGGVTGYQSDNLAAGAAGAAEAPQVTVVVVHSGLLTILSLTAPPPASTFEARWDGVWTHILANTQLGAGPAGAQPCGA